MSIVEFFGDAQFGMLQERPYPVAAPQSLEAVQYILQTCAENNWRVLPLGQGSSFPPNFALRSERVFAVMLNRLKSVERMSSGRILCGPGTPVAKVLLTEQPLERKTIGGLICGMGDAATRGAARLFWQLVYSVEMLDSRGQVVVMSGPASPQFLLSASSSLVLESRGKAGVLTAVEFCTDQLPFELKAKSLMSGQTEQLTPVISRQVGYRQVDALSLFDW